MAWSPGDSLQGGKYIIDKLLGQGGFGLTYRAQDTTGQYGRFVAIKTLNDTVRGRSDFQKRHQDFLNEAIKIKGCQHPHIVKVYEVIEESGLWCMVMEYIHGEDLATRIRRGVLPEDEALKYIRQVGEALKVVHAQGLLHRDVKPGNIMVRFTDNEAVLIDFGIAREFTPDLTQTHSIHGTECYTPIEQYNPRAKRGAYIDVYALAATLYVLLTAQLPTAAPNRMAGDTLIPPKQHNHGISDRVNQAILKGMALRKENRPQSVQAWLRLLGLENPSADGPLSGQWRFKFGFKFIASSAATLATTVLFGLLLDHVVAPFLIEVPVVGDVVLRFCKAVDASCFEITGFILDKTLTGHSDSARSVAISPDGKTLASGSYDKTIKLWNLETGQLEHTFREHSDRGHSDIVYSVAISPDGQTLASGSGDKTIKLWNLETRQLENTLTGHDGNVYSVAISPDESTLASGSGDGTIKLWNLETGNLQHTLTGHDDPVYSVAISPDGKTLASGSGDGIIKLWNLETGKLPHTLTGHSGILDSLAISPDGKTLASGSKDQTIKLYYSLASSSPLME